MSKHSILVPDIGAEQADVIEILVRPGQAVAAEQAIVVLESDKASMEVPCPQAGTVATIAVSVGQTVKQGDLLLELEAATVQEAALMNDARASAAALPVAAIGAELNAVSDLLDKGEAAAPSPSLEAVPVAPAAASSAPPAAAPAPEAGVAPAPAAAAVEAAAVQLARVPDIGAEEADVIEVLVKPGDAVALEQPIVVLESAKASMEVPSPVAGVVRQVLVKVGDKVFENTPLLEVAVAAGAAAGGATAAPASPVAPSPAVAPAPVASVAPEVASSSHAPLATVHAGPAVRRLARELGVDLGKVRGSGPRERILKEDVHAFVKQSMRQLVATTAAAPAGGAPAAAPLPLIDFAKWGAVERVPLGRIQRVSEQNLHRAWTTIPHVTQFDEADITALEAFRVAHKDAFKAEGLSLTLLSFLVKTVAHTLREFPRFASSLEPDGATLVMKDYVHIGVAVDTPEGLVVPVIRDADRKGIRDIARELGELSAKARAKKLTPAEMQGACFSISSLGGIGGTAFTPIVNWPEVAILGVSRATTKPVWNGREFEPRLMLPLSLSYDHRVIDGADAARFTTALARRLADLRELLL